MTVTITVTNNGPFVIATSDGPPVSIIDARGQSSAVANDGTPIALCRCGQSRNKPYCDGTHSTIGFTDGE